MQWTWMLVFSIWKSTKVSLEPSCDRVDCLIDSFLFDLLFETFADGFSVAFAGACVEAFVVVVWLLVEDSDAVFVVFEGGGSVSEIGSIGEEEMVEFGPSVGEVTNGEADSGVEWVGTRLPWKWYRKLIKISGIEDMYNM